MRQYYLFFLAAITFLSNCRSSGSSSSDSATAEWQTLATETFLVPPGQAFTWVTQRADFEGMRIHFKPDTLRSVTVVLVSLERHVKTDELALLIQGDHSPTPSYYVVLPKQLIEDHGSDHIRNHSFRFEAHSPGTFLNETTHLAAHQITLAEDNSVTVEQPSWGRLRQGDESYKADDPQGIFENPPMLKASMGVINSNEHGMGSLADAINIANANAGADTIIFTPPNDTDMIIVLTAPLPAITSPVVLVGDSHPNTIGRVAVTIDARASGGNGLVLASGSEGSVIRMLRILGSYGNAGILIRSNSNMIVGNQIGVSTSGAIAETDSGITIDEGAAHNIIGGTTGMLANVIGGALQAGIILRGYDNRISGNYIGAFFDETPAPNEVGILIDETAYGNIVGGTYDEFYNNVIKNSRTSNFIQKNRDNTIYDEL